jgi:AP-3 complex subunit mu
VLPLYLAHPVPRPSFLYESSTNPPTLIHSITQDRLLFLGVTATDTNPLSILEFLHRVADAFEDFLGSPLLASKISGAYDVVAQLLGEMCDCGEIATTEPNALRDLVEAPTLTSKLLGGVGLPSATPSLSSSPTRFSPLSVQNNNQPAIPWRKSNVRHTSNELYVDILETLHVITSPSGQPLSAFAHGSIIFTARVSGVPDLFLSLTTPAGGANAVAATVNLPVFHPCVRLARWKDRPGELSFVPPDGRFLLMAYESDLLGSDYLDRVVAKGKKKPSSGLQLPASVTVRTGLGPSGADFEVRLAIDPKFGSKMSSGGRTDAFNKPTGFGSAKNSGTSAHPIVEDLVVRVPIAAGVRSLSEMKASKGEVRWSPGEEQLEWRVSSKDVATLVSGLHSSTAHAVATLKCGVVAAAESEPDDAETEIFGMDQWEYDDGGGAYQSNKTEARSDSSSDESKSKQRSRANKMLMPDSASISFQVKGWLASGIKVDKLTIDTNRSRGLGAGVKPFQGVKYVSVSHEGVETRC